MEEDGRGVLSIEMRGTGETGSSDGTLELPFGGRKRNTGQGPNAEFQA